MVSLLTKGKEVYGRMKREVSEQILSQALNLLGHASEGNYRYLVGVFDHLANTEQQKLIAAWVVRWMSPGSPGGLFLKQVLQEVHPNVRKNYLAKLLVRLFFRNPYALRASEVYHGFMPPTVLLISPTMKCNYRCLGCYAEEYTRSQDLPAEVVDRVVTEAKEMGVGLIVFVGGEPFVYRPLMDIIKKHRDMPFHIYTNGSFIDESMADQLLELGNVAPQFSLEGWREETDARRGHGAFDRVMRAMDLMRERGLIFSFSACVTKNNVDQVTSDAWIDMLIEKGCHYGWYFLYMPVGGDHDTALMPTPEQRNRLRLATNHIRKTKPILLADFWGDSPLTGGCIAGGRIYAHINHKGDLEPCIFCHFTCPGANVKEVSLAQALSAPLFAHWRQMQPFSANALRPCPIIDHPKILRTALRAWGAVPSHPEAENIVDLLAEDIDRYSAEMSQIYTPAWDEEYPWGPDWMTIMDYPKEKVLRRQAAYQERRAREKQETPSPTQVQR